MKFHVLTLFPQAFTGPLQHSILGRAQERGLVSVRLTDIRDHTHDAHNTADDYQFGGGFGMVMKPEPIFEAVEVILSSHSEEERRAIPVLLMSPQGETLDQRLVEDLSHNRELVIICGHYAGVDERVREHLMTREVSIGDYVLTGGELAAMVLIDAVSRCVDGVVGSRENVLEDSFTNGLLQHPLYTRPAIFRGFLVPEILRSGHHAEIERWRRHQSLRIILEKRPDLLDQAVLTPDDLTFLRSQGWPPPEVHQP
jgi:tRNA (guanine37-N1)-methyltransferase